MNSLAVVQECLVDLRNGLLSFTCLGVDCQAEEAILQGVFLLFWHCASMMEFLGGLETRNSTEKKGPYFHFQTCRIAHQHLFNT